jgi:ribonuclease HI
MREVGKKSVVVYVDGLCEPRNPFGVVAYGLVVYKDGARLHQEAEVIGEGAGMSNNVGEYSALVRALEWLTDQGLRGEEILVKSDSQLLVNQMTGLWDCHGGFYVGKYLEARRLASRFGKLGFQWVPREENGEADALSMEAYEGYCRDRGVEPKYRRRRLATR